MSWAYGIEIDVTIKTRSRIKFQSFVDGDFDLLKDLLGEEGLNN